MFRKLILKAVGKSWVVWGGGDTAVLGGKKGDSVNR